MADLRELLRSDYETTREDIRVFGEELRGNRKKLGPRQQKALREYLMDQPVEGSLPVIQKLLATAKHVEGERVPCAACRFLGEGEGK